MAGHNMAKIAEMQIQEFSRPQYLTPPNFGDNPQPPPTPAARKRKPPDEEGTKAPSKKRADLRPRKVDPVH